jgi:hypothetical protein
MCIADLADRVLTQEGQEKGDHIVSLKSGASNAYMEFFGYIRRMVVFDRRWLGEDHCLLVVIEHQLAIEEHRILIAVQIAACNNGLLIKVSPKYRYRPSHRDGNDARIAERR